VRDSRATHDASWATVDSTGWPLWICTSMRQADEPVAITKLVLTVAAGETEKVVATFDDGTERTYEVQRDSHLHLELYEITDDEGGSP
jgi:hypothetical protein